MTKESDFKKQLGELQKITANTTSALLKVRISQLEEIIRATLWMARRYADNRRTFAPTIVNKCIADALAMGIVIDDDKAIGRYARDGQLGEWNEKLERFELE